MKNDEPYTVVFSRSTRTDGLVVKASSCKLGNMGSISSEFWNSLQPLSHFVWHWASQSTDTRAFMLCCALHNFFLGYCHTICQWQSHADSVLTLDMNIWRPLFWSTWSGALGQDSATWAGLAHGCDYSSYSLWAKVRPLFFLEFLKILEK